MLKQSAGILVFRRTNDIPEVLLAHPAGPFWSKRDSWSIPKGELDDDEDHLAAAEREFIEEVGLDIPEGPLIDLGVVKQSNDKFNYIWAVEGDPDLANFYSEPFTMEWPPKSGVMQEFPEMDKVAWFELAVAKQKLFKNQIEFIDRLATHLQIELPPTSTQQSLL